MFKRLVLAMLLVAVVALAAGCTKKVDVKAEKHETIDTEEVIDQRTVIE